MTKKYRILDLDNCIADDEWRISRINWNAAHPDDHYQEYHSLAHMDVAHNLHLWENCAHLNFIIFTARPEQFHDKTIRWLAQIGLLNMTHLFMRPAGVMTHSAALKEEMLDRLINVHGITVEQIEDAYDDRQDVVNMYIRRGIAGKVVKIHNVCAYTMPANHVAPVAVDGPKQKTHAADFAESLTADVILAKMAETFRERNAIYSDNYKRVGAVMTALFPGGVVLSTQDDHNKFHLFELIIVKLTRFANSGLTHQDSIHDAAVYAAMVESLLDGLPIQSVSDIKLDLKEEEVK